jgi:transmembrane sensor
VSLSAYQRKPEPIAEAAAAWALREKKGLSRRQRARRDVWLAASPLHEKAYHAALAALIELDRHAAHPEIVALRQAALAHSEQRPISRMLATWAACVLAIALFGSAGWWFFNRSATVQAAAYATSVGERSTVPLADGSVMTLNTASAVEVEYMTEERSIRLLKGQALFTVAHDKPAPFRVYAGDKIVTAVGTVFDVRIDGEQVRVSVIEGAVRVAARFDNPVLASSARPGADAETLVAGEALIASPEGATSVKPVDVERLTSWRSGLMSFEDTPLAEAIAEVNRYTHRPVTLADPRLGEYRVSGTFRVGEPERFAHAMTQLFPVSVTSSNAGTVIKPQ